MLFVRLSEADIADRNCCFVEGGESPDITTWDIDFKRKKKQLCLVGKKQAQRGEFI
jgi:hypothetical protein